MQPNDAHRATGSQLRVALTPLSIRDLPPLSLTPVQEACESAASSPVSTVLSPTESDIMPVPASATLPDRAGNPILRRAISCSALAAGPELAKQRRKRSRVTPAQLARLEQHFASDPSPTSVKRKDLACELGMDERQAQIWFQNRRAKAKLQLKLKARSFEKLEPPPESPPELASGFDADIHALIHEDEEVTVFPCTDLTIGTWRRMASAQHDLLVYTCAAKRSLTWFIRSGGRSFKMELPYEHILDARFANISPGVGSATFALERPPTFYMEHRGDGGGPGDAPPLWHVCGDWTEGMQGTTQLRHHLVGPAHQLSALVNSIGPAGAGSEIALYTPTPPVSDAGSSPEVYTRALHSPFSPSAFSPSPSSAGSSLVLRRPSSLSSLRMLHHPSLERLRVRAPARQASVPLLRSPLSGASTPTSPSAASSSCTPRSPAALLLGVGQLPMPGLPRLHYEYPYPYPYPHSHGHGYVQARAESPYECAGAGELPLSAASVSVSVSVSAPGYFDVDGDPARAPWGMAPGGYGGYGAPHQHQHQHEYQHEYQHEHEYQHAGEHQHEYQHEYQHPHEYQHEREYQHAAAAPAHELHYAYPVYEYREEGAEAEAAA